MKNSTLNLSVSEQREHLFFFVMALIITFTVAIAFGLFFKAGFSNFGAPWWVHLHAATFLIWIALYITQNFLVHSSNLSLHRKLGRVGAVYTVWVVLVGLILTPVTLLVGRWPPFFTPSFFLALDWVNIVVFAILFYSAIVNHTRTDWHRRLMLCATICLIAPAWGRLIVLSGNGLSLLNNVGALLSYIAIAMIADWFIRGRVHQAYFWGFSSLIGMGVLIKLLSNFPPFIHLAEMMAGQSSD